MSEPLPQLLDHKGLQAHDDDWVDATAVARYLGVSRNYVYEHADELGARPLGTGPKPRLRFLLAEVDRRWAARSADSQLDEAKTPVATPVGHRRRATRTRTGVPLLPVKG